MSPTVYHKISFNKKLFPRKQCNLHLTETELLHLFSSSLVIQHLWSFSLLIFNTSTNKRKLKLHSSPVYSSFSIALRKKDEGIFIIV